MRANFQGNYSPLPPRMQVMPNIREDRPAYRVIASKGCFLDDVMYFEGQLVYWDEEPNKDMEPLNALAREASNAFFDKCEKAGRAASAAKGMRYIPLRRPVEEDRALNTAESRRPEIVKGDGGIPVMGARKRGRPKAERIDTPIAEEAPIADLTKRKGELIE